MLTKEQIIEIRDKANSDPLRGSTAVEMLTLRRVLDDLVEARNALQEILQNLDHYVDITSDDDEDWECEPEDRWRMVRDIREPLLKYHPDNTERSLPKESTRSTQKETP